MSSKKIRKVESKPTFSPIKRKVGLFSRIEKAIKNAITNGIGK
jgi:hypothetical protein